MDGYCHPEACTREIDRPIEGLNMWESCGVSLVSPEGWLAGSNWRQLRKLVAWRTGSTWCLFRRRSPRTGLTGVTAHLSEGAARGQERVLGRNREKSQTSVKGWPESTVILIAFGPDVCSATRESVPWLRGYPLEAAGSASIRMNLRTEFREKRDKKKNKKTLRIRHQNTILPKIYIKRACFRLDLSILQSLPAVGNG